MSIRTWGWYSWDTLISIVHSRYLETAFRRRTDECSLITRTENSEVGSWKFYPAAQNFTNHMLFWNTHTFKTIYLLWKRYHLKHRSSIFSAIQRNHQRSANNTSYVLELCCALVLTWRKGPCQSPRNGLSIADLELYVIERGTGVCDPITY